MYSIEKKYLDNTFIILGRSGCGKSTTCKTLTGNQNIRISSSKQACTTTVSYNPGCLYNSSHLPYYFTMVDTPGLDDSEGRDKDIYQQLREMLQNKNMKVKGIIIAQDFQTQRFGESEQNIIEKIIQLVPIKDFWKYITILVTHCFTDKPKKLPERKKKFKNELKSLFEKKFFFKYFQKYGIMGEFSDINVAFVNFDDEEPSMDDDGVNELKEILEKQLNKEPIFQECKIELKENVSVLDYNDDWSRKTATLYSCKVKNIKFFGQNGKILNEINTIIEKKKIRDLKRSELDSKDAFLAGGILSGISLVALVANPLNASA